MQLYAVSETTGKESNQLSLYSNWSNTKLNYLLFNYLNSLLLFQNPLELNLDSLYQQSPADTNIANLKFFHLNDFRRSGFENPTLELNKNKIPQGFEQTNIVDTLGRNVTTFDQIDSNQVSYSYTLSLDEYLALRKKQLNNEIWDSILTRHDLAKSLSQGDISRMIASATGISIPIPQNAIMGIFGKPELSITVNGEVNLRIGWRFDTQNLGTVSAFGQNQSSPIFNQDIRINVNAKIGDKLQFGTNWNTRSTFDNNNQFKVGYDGYDDDIVRLVEVGNINFPIPSTLIGGGQSLFGVRADFQFGPLFLKSVFSQRRAQRKFVDVRGGTSTQPFAIRAYDFAKNHFFLDTVYQPIYDDYFKNSTPVIPNTPAAQYYRVKYLQLWESTNDTREGVLHAGNGVAIADLRGLRSNETYTAAEKSRPIQTGIVERGNFMLMDSTQYSYNANLGTLTIKNLRQDRYYAVSYAIEGPSLDSSDNIFYGTFSRNNGDKDTLMLRLVYRPNMLPSYKLLWDRQMKNIYQINAMTNVDISNTNINLWYIRSNNDSTDVLQGAPDKLVTIFGVDQVNNSSGSAPPDGIFDLRVPFFDATTGEITFPNSKPFSNGLRAYFNKIGNPELAEQYTFEQVYDTTYDIAARNTARNRFVISGQISGRATNRIALGAFNLSPGSVRVTLDGAPLREYQDYIVDYYSGILTIRNARASLPNANLKVEYEQQDLMLTSTKTLAGLRADYQLFKTRFSNASIGGTFMFYNQSAVIDRVRLGDEPVANTMMGFDAKFNLDMPWLTKALDLLPLYDTKAPSNFNMQGEWALMMPNPNKRTSEIASDHNSSVVYIDDFEAAQRYISLGLTPTQWQHSSAPVDNNIDTSAVGRNLYRGQMFWYQYFIPRIPIIDVYPNNQNYIQGRQFLSPIYVDFNPDFRGIYNKNPEFLDTLDGEHYDRNNAFSLKPENRPKIWGGMQRLLSSFYTNFDQDNIEFIEIMMYVEEYEPGTKMSIDLGQISEDIIPNGKLDTEDGITTASPFPNGIIDAGEDIGIDAQDNTQEQEEYPFPLNNETDPARDDYFFDFGKNDDARGRTDFIRYNNFENNSKYSELGQFPDQEILNQNNGQTISLADSYFSYDVDITPNPNLNPQIVGGNPAKKWYLYRIPIRKPNASVGNPSFSNIQYVRMTLKGGKAKLIIADWRLVGSQWQRVNDFQSVPKNDSILQVSFVNLWENANAPDFYEMPPGVTQPRVLNNTDPYTDIKQNEQSIAMSVQNLNFGEERMATRIFQSLDIFYYKTLKFFIHGDGTMPAQIWGKSIPKAYAYLRFGIDSLNYYEYRRPLLRGWQDISIDLTELTSIKQARDTSQLYNIQTFPAKNDTLATFVIRGNPILTRVQFFGFGVKNPPEQFPNQLTTTMWVDELRLIDPEKHQDWAGVGNANLKLADLGEVSVNFSRYQPNFHKIEDRFGNRVTSSSWSVTANGNLEKFAPKSFSQMRLPITATHSEQFDNPEYVANNDINLTEAALQARNAAYQSAISSGMSETDANTFAKNEENSVKARSQSLRVQDSWAITQAKLGIPINHWLMKNTLNALSVGYSYSQEFERSPIYEERFNWMWKLNIQYGITIPDVLSVKPLQWLKSVPVIDVYNNFKINFLPASFGATLDFMRRRQTEQSRYLDFPSPVLREFNGQRQAQFSWKFFEGSFLNPLLDYSFNTTSTLIPFELDATGKQRSGNQLASQMFFQEGQPLRFGNNTLHSQVFTLNIRPQLPNILNITRFVDIGGSFSTTYSWNNPLQPDPAIRDVVKTANYNNNIRLNNSLKLKALGNTWFKLDKKTNTRATAADSSSKALRSIARVIKTVFFDWDKVDFNFSQSNSSINPGVFGGNGFDNFWSRGATFRGSLEAFGPSVPYQLGLVANPHGNFNIASSSSFPFFSFESSDGRRPPNSVLQDNYRQQSVFEIKTSRLLWPGATLDLSFKSDLGYNRNQTVLPDSNGIPHYTNIIALKTLNRSFLTFPSVFGLNPFGNTIESVVKKYNTDKAQIEGMGLDSNSKNGLLQDALSAAFYDELRAFKFVGGDVGKFLPDINWAFHWEGLEKWDLWKDLLKRLSLEHSYQSTYQEQIQLTDIGKFILAQSVQYGFSPLIGLNASFDEKKVGGNLTASLRWSTQKSYMVNTASRSMIASQSTNDITGQASYIMRGFDFPLLGLKLKNDLEFSFLGTFKTNDNTAYNIQDSTSYQGNSNNGWTVNGTKQIIVEPRARYSLSNIVTASLFVRYEGTFTAGSAQPGFHTFQFGLDIRIGISGGR